MAGITEQIKHILINFKIYQFFIGENMNLDGMVALLDSVRVVWPHIWFSLKMV